MRLLWAFAVVLGVAGLLTACGTGTNARKPPDALNSYESTPSASVVPAMRQPLTTNVRSPVVHDTEADTLLAHSGRLFASADQWEYAGPTPAGQILVKNSRDAPWQVFEQTQSLRVQETLDSFSIPRDQGLGPGHSLLITHAVINGRSEIQWLLDRAKSFAPADSFALASSLLDVRSFGAHESGGVWSVYAGVEPTGIDCNFYPADGTAWIASSTLGALDLGNG